MVDKDYCDSREVERMRGFLSSILPATIYNPNLIYDAKFLEVRGEQKGDTPREPAVCLARLTVQQNGSAYPDYKSVTDASVFEIPFYVQARHMNDDFLIVGFHLDKSKKLVRPMRLRLQDLIGFRRLEKIE